MSSNTQYNTVIISFLFNIGEQQEYNDAPCLLLEGIQSLPQCSQIIIIPK